jgi:ribosomal protein L37E
MIKISLEIFSSSINRVAKHIITCPQCLANDWFFNFSSKVCPQCGFPWGDVTKLLNNINVRKQFYKDGEIDA